MIELHEIKQLKTIKIRWILDEFVRSVQFMTSLISIIMTPIKIHFLLSTENENIFLRNSMYYGNFNYSK